MMSSLASLKTRVLKDEMGYLCEELGDPGRYIPSLRAKNLLDSNDTQLIRSEATSARKTEVMLDIMMKREGHLSEHPLDIFINELKKQRVQVHIARRLGRTLKRREKEAENTQTSDRTPDEKKAPPGTYESPQSQPMSTVETQSVASTKPVPASSSQPSYEVSPLVGLVPNEPPPLTATYTVNPSSINCDPEHGIGPGTPPPSSSGTLSEPPSMPTPEAHITSGMHQMTISDHMMMNGGGEGMRQQPMGYNTIDSATTVSSTFSGYTEADLEMDRLREENQNLKEHLCTMQLQLNDTIKELTFARQELAGLKQQFGYRIAEVSTARQETVSRPGSLFPDPNRYAEPRYRHGSPARPSIDNLSMRSANSNTSVNSIPGAPAHLSIV